MAVAEVHAPEDDFSPSLEEAVQKFLKTAEAVLVERELEAIAATASTANGFATRV